MQLRKRGREHYAETLEEAEKMKERFMSGQDEFYGDLVDDVWISAEKEEREFFVKDKPVSIHKKLERYQQEVRSRDADRDVERLGRSKQTMEKL